MFDSQKKSENRQNLSFLVQTELVVLLNENVWIEKNPL